MHCLGKSFSHTCGTWPTVPHPRERSDCGLSKSQAGGGASDRAGHHYPRSTASPKCPFPGAGVFSLAKVRELLPVNFHLGGLAGCPSGLSDPQLPESPFPPLCCKEQCLQFTTGVLFYSGPALVARANNNKQMSTCCAHRALDLSLCARTEATRQHQTHPAPASGV